tara:strand:+ start:1250 stop:1651 length:402 start_codon:yes stop_codon:yes gene_type:complete
LKDVASDLNVEGVKWMAEGREKYILRKMRENREGVPKEEKDYYFENGTMFVGSDTAHMHRPDEALDKQVGGNHYKDCGIQPVEYIYSNGLDFLEGNVVKYITRHRTKGDGEQDIRKVIHYAEMILEMAYKKGE